MIKVSIAENLEEVEKRISAAAKRRDANVKI